MNTVKKILRFVWHAVYYVVSFKPGMNFAMRCREVVEKIDLEERPKDKMSRFRLSLHLSLCQACANYFRTTQELKKAVGILVKKKRYSNELDVLNLQLLRKFSRP